MNRGAWPQGLQQLWCRLRLTSCGREIVVQQRNISETILCPGPFEYRFIYSGGARLPQKGGFSGVKVLKEGFGDPIWGVPQSIKKNWEEFHFE